MIAIQVSLYPLGEVKIDEKLQIFWNELKNKNVNFKINPLSTIIWGEEEEELFNIIFKAYKKTRESCKAVMVTTVTTGQVDEIKNLLGFL